MYIFKHIPSNPVHVNNFDMYKMWQFELHLCYPKGTMLLQNLSNLPCISFVVQLCECMG